MSGIKQVLTKAKRAKDSKESKDNKKSSDKDTGFQSIVRRAAKDQGSKEQNEKVAAAAFWKQQAKK